MKFNINKLLEPFAVKQAYFSQPQILQRMIAQLPKQTVDTDDKLSRPLSALKVRDKQDETIALLDAWATVLDVLGFYQGQYNQENYLKTATEWQSIKQLAHTIGYELRPAVAASTYLVFSVDENANNTGIATVPKATKVQSIPSDGGLPQTFETSDNLLAYAEWNELYPSQNQQVLAPVITSATQSVYLTGVNNGVAVGDMLLLTGHVSANTIVAYLIKVAGVIVDNKANKTEIRWENNWSDSSNELQNDPGITLSPTDEIYFPQLYIFRKRAACFGNNAPEPTSDSIEKFTSVWNDSKSQSHAPFIYLDQMVTKIRKDSWTVLLSIKLDSNSTETNTNEKADGTNQSTTTITHKLYKVADVFESSVADFGLSGRVSLLKLAYAGPGGQEDYSENLLLRNTTVYTESELLPLAHELITIDELLQDKITLDKKVTDLPAGKKIIVSSLPAKQVTEKVAVHQIKPDVRQIMLKQPLQYRYAANSLTIQIPGRKNSISANLADDNTHVLFAEMFEHEIAHINELDITGTIAQQYEVCTVRDSQIIDGKTVITLTSPLRNNFWSKTSVLLANTVSATHGETVTEIIGSGDNAKANQQFTLKKSPLTYLSAPTAKGIQNTLAIYINEQIYWTEAERLNDLQPTSQCYVLSQNEHEQTTVIFGDGQHGARLPSGQENIKATYRFGGGPAGNVAKDAITLLKTRPQGITTVTNPMAATGGLPAETLTEARRNAPYNVLTMKRIVSLQDFADFVQAYAGIGKAKVFMLQHGQLKLLQITIAGHNGVAIDPNSLLFQNLQAAIAAVRNPGQGIYLQPYTSKQFNLTAALDLAANYREETVFAQVKQALLTHFSVDQRDFAQPVAAAEIIQVIQSVPGLIGVQLEQLYLQDETPAFNDILIAKSPQISLEGDLSFQPAELLTINPQGIQLKSI